MPEQVKRFVVICAAWMAMPLLASAQNTALEESMYADGKFNVVFAIVFVMLAVMLVYLALLDRRLRKFEKEENTHK
jgi:uncharacterized membrane protein YhaH (DUF805 family)